VYSLSPPCLASKTVPGHKGQREALRDLCLDEDGSTLIALVGVLLVHSGVMLLWVVTALQDDGDELSKLGQCVAGVMYVCLRLGNVSMAW
jgi:hypothetical protein